jgi:hypothetical protein
MAEKRQEFYESFCPVRQPDGGRVFWVDPDDFVESMLGFPRFFTLENEVIKALFDLAEDVPEEWRALKVKVVRRDKQQTIWGAVRSALYGATFGLQGSNMRAAGNHKIQSTGAQLTKMLQGQVWSFQPCGVHPWLVRPMNVHDELMTAIAASFTATSDTTAEPLENLIATAQANFIKRHKSLVPMLGMKWHEMANWAGK